VSGYRRDICGHRWLINRNRILLLFAHFPEMTPLEVVHEFIRGVDDGTIRRDLAEDCILNFYSRNVRGAKDITGFMRTQVTRRYKHEAFDEAASPSIGDEVLLQDIYILRLGFKVKNS